MRSHRRPTRFTAAALAVAGAALGLLALAGATALSAEEVRSLLRPRSPSVDAVAWTDADLALIDEARVLLGSRRPRSGADATARTYGHIGVDEAQDLSPMQLRMVARRSLSGSITVVGDIGQATGSWAPDDWSKVTAHLPAARPPRLRLRALVLPRVRLAAGRQRVVRVAPPGRGNHPHAVLGVDVVPERDRDDVQLVRQLVEADPDRPGRLVEGRADIGIGAEAVAPDRFHDEAGQLVDGRDVVHEQDPARLANALDVLRFEPACDQDGM